MEQSQAGPDLVTSVLCTASLPSFTPSGFGLTPHHLVSSQLSYSHSFEEYIILFTKPPSTPYQQPTPTDPHFDPPTFKRRKLQLTPDSAPADYSRHRQQQQLRQSKQSSTEIQTEQRHAELVEGVKAGWEAVREEWLKRAGAVDGWIGDVAGMVEWVGKEEGGRREVDWAAILEAYDDQQVARLALRLAALEGRTIDSAELAECVVLNDTCATQEVKLRIAGAPESTVQPEEDGDDAPPPPPPLSAQATLALPPGSTFLLSAFANFSQPNSALFTFTHSLPAIDLVILDPPWPNASVTRAGSYETFDPYVLGRLDLKTLLGNKPALVAVWLTNKVKFRRLVVDKLFRQWGVDGETAEFTWIKITDGSVGEGKGGEPVWDWDSTHRRCYEGELAVLCTIHFTLTACLFPEQAS